MQANTQVRRTPRAAATTPRLAPSHTLYLTVTQPARNGTKPSKTLQTDRYKTTQRPRPTATTKIVWPLQAVEVRSVWGAVRISGDGGHPGRQVAKKKNAVQLAH